MVLYDGAVLRTVVNLFLRCMNKKKLSDWTFTQCDHPSKVLHSELLECDILTMSYYDATLVKKNIYNARRKEYPKLYKSIQEIYDPLDPASIKTNKDERFVFINDREIHIIRFSTESNF